ncbi:MAG: hypothetical protein LKM43_04765 [Wolbachia endosymbiont of Penenirmus auritus]|nr:hypothetical protein [Wolbachia endosymbiont of Penenirmus auritus]
MKKKNKNSKKIGKMLEKIIQSNEKLKQEVQELYKENEELKTKLKLISVEYRKLEDKLEKTERAEQQTYEDAELIISENYKTMRDLRAQLQRLEQEKQEVEECYKCAIEKLAYKIEDLKNELESEKKQKEQLQQEIKEIEKECLPLLELKLEGYENEIKMLKERDEEREEMFKELQKIVADKVQDIENLKGELQNKKEGEVFRNQAEALEKDIRLLASKQIDLNQVHTITVGVPNDPDNVPLKKRKPSSSLSIDSGYNSDKESHNNHCHSSLVASVTLYR